MTENNSRSQCRTKMAFSSDEKFRSKFWKRVKKTESCWLWDKPLRAGYGVYGKTGFQISAHRFAKIITDGMPEPRTLLACHICRNKHCVRPSHIYWGTAQDNRQDQWKDRTMSRPNSCGEKNKSSKLKRTQARAIFQAFHADGESARSLARLHNVSFSTCLSIVTRETWISSTQDLYEALDCAKYTGRRKGERVHGSRLSEQKAKAIYKLLADGSVSKKRIAEQFKISPVTVSHIGSGRLWAHVTGAVMQPRASRAKLSEKEFQISVKRLQSGESRGVIARDLGVSASTLGRFLKRHSEAPAPKTI